MPKLKGEEFVKFLKSKPLGFQVKVLNDDGTHSYVGIDPLDETKVQEIKFEKLENIKCLKKT